MKTKSPHIDLAIHIAINSGNSIKEFSEGWSKVQQVIHMKNQLSPSIKDAIQDQIPSLRYWSTNKTPHNPAEEGFICDSFQVGLSFPKS